MRTISKLRTALRPATLLAVLVLGFAWSAVAEPVRYVLQTPGVV